MPSHLTPSEPPPDMTPESELATEMPPPLFSSIEEQIARPIDDIHTMLIVGTIIVVGIIAFIILRRRRK